MTAKNLSWRKTKAVAEFCTVLFSWDHIVLLGSTVNKIKVHYRDDLNNL